MIIEDNAMKILSTYRYVLFIEFDTDNFFQGMTTRNKFHLGTIYIQNVEFPLF